MRVPQTEGMQAPNPWFSLPDRTRGVRSSLPGPVAAKPCWEPCSLVSDLSNGFPHGKAPVEPDSHLARTRGQHRNLQALFSLVMLVILWVVFSLVLPITRAAAVVPL